MTVEWRFLCEDCKIEVVLGREKEFSLPKMNRLSGSELRKCAEVVEKLRGFQKGQGEGKSALDQLEVLLFLLLEHRDHDTLLYNSSQDVRTENLPWFERWSWKEDITPSWSLIKGHLLRGIKGARPSKMLSGRAMIYDIVSAGFLLHNLRSRVRSLRGPQKLRGKADG